MADTKISQLADGGAVQTTDQLPVARSGSTLRVQVGSGAALNVPASGDAAAGELVKGDDTRLSNSRTPSAHAASHASGGGDAVTLAQSQVTGLVTALAATVPTTRTVNGQPLSANVTVSKSDVGLGNADNTSDVNKPVSTAQAAADNLRVNILQPITALGTNSIATNVLRQAKSISANTTFTFSATPSAGQTFGLILTNTDTDPIVVTIPTSYSLAFGSNRTSFSLLQNQTVYLQWYYNGTVYILTGDPIPASDLSPFSSAIGLTFPAYDPTGVLGSVPYSVVSTGISKPQTKSIDIDVVVSSSTTFVNLITTVVSGDLSGFAPLAASCSILINASAVGGAKLRFGYSGGAGTYFNLQVTAINASTGAVIGATRITSDGGSYSIPVSTTAIHVHVEGGFYPDSAGDFTVDFAQAVASGSSSGLSGSSATVYPGI